jgi:hypothetical protein
MLPMLPDAFAPHKIIYPVLVQPKLSGLHVLYQAGWFTTEDDEPLQGDLAYLTRPLRDMFTNERTILDGVLTDDSFRVFDVVSSKIPYKERFDTIAQIINDTTKYQSAISAVITRKVFDSTQADDQYNTWISEGYKGMIYRLGHCFYTKATSRNKFNRNKQLLLRHDPISNAPPDQ